MTIYSIYLIIIYLFFYLYIGNNSKTALAGVIPNKYTPRIKKYMDSIPNKDVLILGWSYLWPIKVFSYKLIKGCYSIVVEFKMESFQNQPV